MKKIIFIVAAFSSMLSYASEVKTKPTLKSLVYQATRVEGRMGGVWSVTAFLPAMVQGNSSITDKLGCCIITGLMGGVTGSIAGGISTLPTYAYKYKPKNIVAIARTTGGVSGALYGFTFSIGFCVIDTINRTW
jgi:hypothetical protein